MLVVGFLAGLLGAGALLGVVELVSSDADVAEGTTDADAAQGENAPADDSGAPPDDGEAPADESEAPADGGDGLVNDGDDAEAPPDVPGFDSPASVTEIAQQVGPSVARVDAATPQGQGAGSAVVYREDGILVTNAHVVAQAQQLTVTLPDGDQQPAEVVGADARSDLAVLRVDVDDLPVPTWLEDTSDLQIGEPVVAIGTPFGLDGSVTSGIISALDRTISSPTGASLVDLIQTDAAINPGNSGGALVNFDGEIIGVNTAIVSRGGGNQGIGFAIPASVVRNVADQLLETGSVQHPEIGIAGQTVDPDIARLYNLPVDAGAVIADVRPGSPAEEAGLQPGDIIVGFDGDDIASMPDLAGHVQRHSPGDEVTLDVYRDGEEIEVEVTLAEREQSDQENALP